MVDLSLSTVDGKEELTTESEFSWSADVHVVQWSLIQSSDGRATKLIFDWEITR